MILTFTNVQVVNMAPTQASECMFSSSAIFRLQSKLVDYEEALQLKKRFIKRTLEIYFRICNNQFYAKVVESLKLMMCKWEKRKENIRKQKKNKKRKEKNGKTLSLQDSNSVYMCI